MLKTPRSVREWPRHPIDAFLAEQGLRESTRKVYARIAWNIDESGLGAREWYMHGYSEKVAKMTLGVRRSGVAYYLFWKNGTREKTYKEWLSSLPPAKIGRSDPKREGLEDDEVEELRRVLEGMDVRYQTITLLLLFTGLRISEACALSQENVKADHVVVERAKGNKTRTVPLGKEIRALLDQYLEGVEPPNPWLFYNDLGDRLRPDQVRSFLQALREGNRVIETVTPHVLRHTRATALLEQKLPLPMIQKVLGHAKLATLETYLHPSEKKTRRAVREADERMARGEEPP